MGFIGVDRPEVMAKIRDELRTRDLAYESKRDTGRSGTNAPPGFAKGAGSEERRSIMK